MLYMLLVYVSHKFYDTRKELSIAVVALRWYPPLAFLRSLFLENHRGYGSENIVQCLAPRDLLNEHVFKVYGGDFNFQNFSLTP